jgi:hypothetical protein
MLPKNYTSAVKFSTYHFQFKPSKCVTVSQLLLFTVNALSSRFDIYNFKNVFKQIIIETGAGCFV